MVIRGGAKLFSSYVTSLVFEAQVNVQIDITGKILLTGTVTCGGPDYGLSYAGYFFGDLSELASGSARLIFLLDLPGKPWRDFGGLSLYGYFDLALVDSLGNRITAERLQEKYYVSQSAQQTFNANGLTRTYLLDNKVSSSDTLTVTVGGQKLTSNAFKVTSGNELKLTDTPSARQKVVVEYSYNVLYRDPVTGEATANPNAAGDAPAGFQILMAGGARADIMGDLLFIQLSGQLVMTFFADATAVTFRLDATADLEVSELGVLGAATGRLTIKVKPPRPGLILDPDSIEIYGALRLSTGDGLKKLEAYGLVLQAGLTLTVNTTGIDQKVDLRMATGKGLTASDPFILSPGDFDMLYLSHTPQTSGRLAVIQDGRFLVESTDEGKTGDYILDRYNATVRLLKPITGNTRVEVNYDCQEFLDIHQIVRARSLSVVASGVGAFWFNDIEIFRIAASFSISIDTTGFTIIASGRLTFGPRSSPLLSLNVTALFFLGVQGGKFGFAASFMGNLTAGIEGLQLDVQALVQLNTFGVDVVFTIPQSNPAFETIRDEKGTVLETSRIEQVPAINSDGTPKLDPTTGQRVTTPITSRTVVVSGAAKNIDGTYQPAGYYVLIRAYGRLTIGNGFDGHGPDLVR
jgi:hypothetical protein